MNSNDLQQLRDLFAELTELPAGEREAYFDRATLSDAVRQRLRALLEADAEFFSSTARRAIPLASADSVHWIGRRVGAYVLETELGHGGMGSVFLSHRADDSVEQKVAVKLIRPEQLDEHTLARFRLERQVLALLKHPHIATLLDVGELDDGTPYVVMEYIEGQPLVEYALAHKLDLERRLHLFVEICAAVAYAHRNMVVHRDLKSSNILITTDGQPKLLDFGIAKPLLQRFGTQEIQETGAAQRFFSPYNASPEQLRGDPITVGCDVYGLGVLLYELLAQAPPFDLVGKTADEIQKLILETDPLPPSARAQSTDPTAARSLRGDLDAIVLRALRKAAEDRYPTVDEFTADIRNYLEGRPVAARRGRSWYRVRKFVGRHRIALGVTTLFVMLAAAAGAMLWLQALEVIRQRDRAQHATAFLVETFRAADPEKALGEKITAKQILDQAQRSLTLDSSIGPLLRAELLGRIAEVEIHLSAAKDALPLLALALHDLDLDKHADTETRASLLELKARAAIAADQFDLANESIAEAASSNSSIGLRAAIEQDAIELLYQQGATDELRPHIDKALHEIAPKLSVDDSVRWELLTEVALAEEVAVGAQQSMHLLEDLLRDASGTLQDRPYVLKAKTILVEFYNDAHRNKEAAEIMESLRQSTERLYGTDSVAYARWANLMGNIHSVDARYADALPLFQTALGLYVKWLGPESRSISGTKFNIAQAEENLGQWQQAENSYRESIELAVKVLPDTNENVEMFRTVYALFLNHRHRFDEAESLFKVAISRADRNPKFRDNDVFRAAQLGGAIAQYATAPTREHLSEFERASTLPADATVEIKEILRQQMDVMKFVGLPLPATEPAPNTPKAQ